VENFASYSVIPLIVLLVASLHRISWGKRPRFGAHFTWAMLGLSLPVLITIATLSNWIGVIFLATFIVVVIVVRRRFCRALTRLPKL
jgi:polyferredoxin